MSSPWGATAQSSWRTPASPPFLSADNKGFSNDWLDERNSKIGNRVSDYH